MIPPVLPAPRTLALNGPPRPVQRATLTALAGALHWAPRAAAAVRRLAEPVTGSPDPTAGPAPVVTARHDASLAPEAYALLVTAEAWTLRAGDEAGAYWAVQTLTQLVRAAGSSSAAPVLADLTCADAPRYAVRGLMLDLARRFFGVPELERLVDLASAYRLNRFHLHLTDDQGWRLETDGRPLLTARAAATDVGGGAGGFLTLADYAHLQAYAWERHVEILPEIDLPGHSHAAMLAYPEISPDGAERVPYTGTEVGFSCVDLDAPATWAFVDEVVGSLARHTRGPRLHLGGDEALRLGRAEYVRFVERLGRVVEAHGKQLVMWQEAAGATLPAGTQIQFWSDHLDSARLAAAAADGSVQIVASPARHAYLDQRYHPGYPLGLDWARPVELRDAYAWDPAHAVAGAPPGSVVGVEACLWSETLRSFDDATALTLPRLPALAEVAWGSPPDWERFRASVAVHETWWQEAGLEFYRSPQVRHAPSAPPATTSQPTDMR